MNLVIEVTQEDIDEGVPCAGGLCPIARALGRLLDTDQHGLRVLVNGYHAAIIAPGGRRTYLQLPPAASQFIRWFDHNHHADPLTFEVTADIPQGWLRGG